MDNGATLNLSRDLWIRATRLRWRLTTGSSFIRIARRRTSGHTTLTSLCCSSGASSEAEIVKFLIEHGADTGRIRTTIFGSPLWIAMLSGKEAVARLLLGPGHGPHWLFQICGFRPLYWAIMRDVGDKVSMVRMLLDHAACVSELLATRILNPTSYGCRVTQSCNGRTTTWIWLPISTLRSRRRLNFTYASGKRRSWG